MMVLTFLRSLELIRGEDFDIEQKKMMIKYKLEYKIYKMIGRHLIKNK